MFYKNKHHNNIAPLTETKFPPFFLRKAKKSTSREPSFVPTVQCNTLSYTHYIVATGSNLKNKARLSTAQQLPFATRNVKNET